MATLNPVRPIPDSYYYSGQGRLSMGDRDPTTGKLSGIVFVGNVTTLTLDIATTSFKHKESMSGQRATDFTIIQEKDATFKFTSESLDLASLSQGLYGSHSDAIVGTAVTEVHFAQPGKAFPLDNQNVTSVTSIMTVTSPVALVDMTDYTIDPGFGTVYVDVGTSVVDADGEFVTVIYAHGVYSKLEAFTQGTPPERYLRFEGLNTLNGDLRLIEIPRGAFDPMTGLEFINADVGSGQFSGSILQDTTITANGASQYFRERRILAA